MQLYLFGNCRIGNFDTSFFLKVQEEKQNILAIINAFSKVLSTWHQLNLLFTNDHNTPFKTICTQGEKVLFELEKLEVFNNKQSLTLSNRYLACFELYYNNIGDAEQCYEYNKKLIENRILIDKKMPNFSTDAMAVYFNFMVACYKFRKWEEMEIYLMKTKDYPISSIQQEIRRTHNYCYCGILLYLTTRQLDKAAILVESFLDAKTRYEGRYRLDFLLFTMCHCGWYYFIIGEFDKARTLWREISEGPRYSIENQISGDHQIFSAYPALS